LKPDRALVSPVTDSDGPAALDGPPRLHTRTDGRTGTRTTRHAERLGRLREASYLLDSSVRVPGTGYRIGLDPILGLLPVVGDLPGTVVAASIVAEAAARGVPRETLARMLGVLLVDSVFGSLPVVGDLFDAAWKANERNMRLLETRIEDPANARGDRRVLLAVGVSVGAAVTALGAGTAALVWWVATSGVV
jgi:hypothetical protein